MKDEKAPAWTWFLLVAITLTIMITPSLLWKSSPPTTRSQSAAAQPTLIMPTSETLEIGADWTKKCLPIWTRFQIDPTTSNVEVKLEDGRVFEKTTKGLWYLDGKPAKLPDPVPGFTLYLRSKDLKPTKVVFSTWPSK